VELLGGEDRCRGGPEPAAAARDQEQACKKYPRAPGRAAQHGKSALTYSIFRRQKLFDFRGAARYYESTQEASPMAWPRMLKIRQTFPRPRVTDISAAVAQALGTAELPIKRGDTVAVGAGSRGIANIDVIVGATVRWLRDLGARPFVFPAMGSHGDETVITSVGREVLSKSRIGFGLGIVENGYDETARIEAFTAENLEAGERRLLKDAREWMARLPFSPMDVLIVEEIGKNISGAGMDTNVIGRPSNPHEPFPADPKILWIVALDLTAESYGNAVGIGNADFTTRR